jgi:poly(A) polymerase
MPPRILPRSEHTVSRRDIDPDALKVLYRLKNHRHVAYLVGGGVRDLLLGRRPKDFDIGTSAHPQQVKKLFRNCFIIGRRFRLCHVRFGRKVIEVSTFRRLAQPDEGDTLIRRDNTFGTPEEDAFRRDFTVNALFYDIATFSVIDYVSGLEDLNERVIRTIGDPGVRLREDPVRMLRAAALAARLTFTIDRDTVEAIRSLRGEIVKSSPARLVEELYKILRQGASRRTFELLHELGLLTYLLPEADRAIAEGGERFLGSLARLDEYRNSGAAAPEDLSNAILLGSVLVPLGVPLGRGMAPSIRTHDPQEEDPGEEEGPVDLRAEMAALGETAEGVEDPGPTGPPPPIVLPFARRDVDRLRLLFLAQRRLREVHRSPGGQHALAGRGYFDDAVLWLDIHGGVEGRELANHWREIARAPGPPPEEEPARGREGRSAGEGSPRGRRRRRRRRRRPSASTPPA